MASSRWKRFAFFERHTLTIPPIVMEDLSADAPNMIVTTASLPALMENSADSQNEGFQAMVSSFSACQAAKETLSESSMTLPSQLQQLDSGAQNSTPNNPELALCFMACSSRIHCMDWTMRSHPSLSTKDSEETMYDMDGWRGYFCPLEIPIRAVATCRGTNHHRPLYFVAAGKQKLTLWKDPHLYLSCRRPFTNTAPADGMIAEWTAPEETWKDGAITTVDILTREERVMIAVGTDKGVIIVFVQQASGLRVYLRMPTLTTCPVATVKMGLSEPSDRTTPAMTTLFSVYKEGDTSASNTSAAEHGVCCFEFPFTAVSITAPSSRHDLDGRIVGARGSALVDYHAPLLTVARPDGLYSYSVTERVGVTPIDGDKWTVCLVPTTMLTPKQKNDTASLAAAASYALVASTDLKSGRDAVDIYDATNKIVAFHLLLPPGHKALQAKGLSMSQSHAVVWTSGGTLVTLTERPTADKIALLVQKNLYAAAIVVAYGDPSYQPSDIIQLYRSHAEHLYAKGDFAAAMDQYILTMGSLESSHVIVRYLDAPKIPQLVRYLEELRSRELATPVHDELLRTCYLKLNDTVAARSCTSSSSSSQHMDAAEVDTMLDSNLHKNPKQAMATVCTLDAHHVARVLAQHGTALARALPRETTGLMIALAMGTYSPSKLATANKSTDLSSMISSSTANPSDRHHEPYPVSVWANSLIEHPKLLRMLLQHCNKEKCPLTPSLRRTLLELTLREWNQARRTGDTELEALRHKEAMASFTDSHSSEIGDHDALVIAQLAGFHDGELVLFERLQITPLLLERYAKDGSEKSRRQMLAMGQSDPEVLAQVLGRFVVMATSKTPVSTGNAAKNDDVDSDDEEALDILDDIEEALSIARRQGVLTPVRIARILAGEGTGQFRSNDASSTATSGVPLSVALDYVGSVLDDTRKETDRLNVEVEEYKRLCDEMQQDIDSLIQAAEPSLATGSLTNEQRLDEIYNKLERASQKPNSSSTTEAPPREAFWREMEHDRFGTITRFLAKGVIP